MVGSPSTATKMCSRGRGASCSLSMPTAPNAAPGLKPDKPAAFHPHGEDERGDPHRSLQLTKLGSGCAPSTLPTIATLRGRSTTLRLFPPETTTLADKRGNPAMKPTLHSPHTQRR
ncbi:Hypothetical predicted protein [Pelobates cultripes]|uniref:Uncharacterized protein n=1 Tax=Pelobates cultripes TaxID=61616 RepID=A0AAD1S8Q0_PELCU|nr:Hypothetical predicted protein [Pelobates cultripes]